MREILAKKSYNVYDLADIVKVLRSENGCPWDKVQTHESIRKDLLEEVYEVLEAIDCKDPAMLREELGDVLLQVVFHCQIETEQSVFDLDSVADEVCKKLILRHPHVFGDVNADTVEKVLTNWDAIKKEEKGQETFTDTLKSVPKVFPSLMRAQKLTKRAGRAGVDLADKDQVIGLIKAQLDRIGGCEGCDDEALGNMLLLCAELARLTGGDAEEALGFECDRFTERFEKLEKSGKGLSSDQAAEVFFVKPLINE
ncbi:MAG: nucleoside triphosphate pyrophosphohydrolase [Ruminococcus sp.]|nr:nucleoside triphosphate pyrophosphohydrolase [Ruminococcus sp.]